VGTSSRLSRMNAYVAAALVFIVSGLTAEVISALSATDVVAKDASLGSPACDSCKLKLDLHGYLVRHVSTRFIARTRP